MKYQLFIVGVACVLGAGACKKNAADNAAAGSGATSGGAVEVAKAADKAPAPAATGCSPTAWKEPSGAFCIEPPPGFTIETETTDEFGPDDPTMNVTWTKEAPMGTTDHHVSVTWYPKRGLDEKEDILAQMAGDYEDNIGEEKGTFAGGKGWYEIYALKEEPKTHKLRAVVEGNKRFYRCSSQSYPEPIGKEILAACTSLTPTD